MKGLLTLIALIFATAVALALLTEYESVTGGYDAKTQVLGLPVVSLHQVGAQGWIAFGQVGVGVLVFAQAGFGFVAFTEVGAAVFFGAGQLMGALLTIAQGGFGVFGFLGQVGAGAMAAGQGVVRDRAEEMRELGRELDEILSWRGTPQ